ncbi:hypothetical protein MMC28_005665 [Mycoblastus sanguinarius]|nr:hypothetical protein [Mycoblastus sanguinarius]
MNHSPSASVSLVPASNFDIPSLVRVHMAAFAFDNAVRLMFKHDEYETKLQGMLESQLADPKFAIIKAVSHDTGKITGWQGCCFMGYDGLQGENVITDLEQRTEEIKEEIKEESTGDKSFRSVVHDDSARMQAEWMSNKRHVYINTLVTDPDHQGHGVGSALVRWVTARADTDNVPCWLQSSPVAQSVYAKAGFKNIGYLDVNLAEFAPGGIKGQRGWGVYGFLYMLRLPDHRSIMA